MISTPVSSRGAGRRRDEAFVHRPDVAEGSDAIERPQRSPQAGDDRGGVRSAADDRHRPERELSLRVVDDRLAGLPDRRLVHVGDDADDAERHRARQVAAERADLLRGGDDALADRVFAGETSAARTSG